MKLDLPFATWSGVVLLLYILQNAASSTTTTTSTKNIAYLNHTTQLILPDTWSLRSFTQLSFRTCSPNGGLLSQQDNTEFINLRLQNGSIVLSWNVANNTATFRVAGVFSNNMWYIVGLRFYLGNVNLTVARGQTLLYDRVVASMASSLHQYLFSNELNSAQLEVGKDFVGCIYQGPGVNFNQPGIIETGVVWNNCLLSSRPGCSLADLDGDDCIQLPCKNGGTCRDGIGNYTCECRHNFNGTNCENDLRYLGCDIAPCMNQGTCLPLQGTTTGVPYTCNCANGYTGTDCELVIDDCRSQPCNYGACTNLVGNGYSCDCTGTGYNGQNCSTDIDECLTVDCGNGTCYNFPGSFTCQCGIGFNGDRCQDKIDECRSSPCQNDGTCSNLIDRFNCTCKTGFTGVTCETNIDDCVGVECQSSNAECKDLVNNHRCDCKDGFTGTDPNCVDINECASNPCVSGQSISCDNLENRYFCRCSAGFTGERCEIDINECARNPCQNNASCTQGINMYTCHCLPGFTDHNCSTNINECGSNPCRNGGSCNDQVAGYTCDCVTGWTGSDCSVNFNDCESNPCLNDGTCHDYLAYYNCSCILGFEGDRCDSNINDCLINPCLNNAQCVDLVNDYRCDCAPNWMGKNCSLTYNACNALTPCKNGATCTTQEPSLEYNCSCQVGFSGVNCSHNIDDCLINNCKSYQQCYDHINNYTCGCPPGLEGDLCNVDVDECANNQCRNGAVCINGTGVYTCSCKNTFYNLTQYGGRKLEFYSGYEGEFCGVDINECDYSPCLNGGQCTNSDGGYSCLCSQKDGPTVGFNCELKTSYCDVEAGKLGRPPCSNGGTCISSIREFTCECAPGWTGATCNININECESNPCQYNGSCNDQVNGYNCTCIPGITGPNCETNINECLSNPCQNNGACLDQINQYICNCSDTGFVGINCDVDILECLSNPCQHGSTCKDGIKMYECECYSGYNGTNCQLDIKECDLKPCQYGGTCLEYSNQTLYELGVPGFTDFSYATAAGYKCNCIPGITGPNCDVNIDECASNPCKNGATCNDGINQYQCACVPGYTGLHCETDINECTLYDACQNGATCKDLVNDYRCDCIPYTRSAGGFGGKNCSVRLTGCDSGSLCQHGSSCVPFYADSTNIHGYTCDCPPGYTGQYCQHSTSFTVKNNGFVKSKTSQSVSILSFRFRTSLDKGILMTFQPSVSQAGYLIIQILNSKLKVEYQNQTSVTIDSMAVNDKNWHQVQITLGQQIKVSLDSSLCYQVSDCTTSIANQWTVPVEGHLYFGISDTSVLASRSPYIGCMDDVVVNDFVVYEEGTNFYFNVEKGCPRTEQCGPYTCSRHGDCKDLWYKYECDCTRPYLGTNCSEEYTPATFAKDNMNSFATFNIPSELKNDLQNEVDLSFFIQTRQDDGMIMYVGNTASEASLTFITMEMTDGKLGGRLFFCNSRQTFSSESEYKNGEKHFVQMTIKSGIFSMVIKNDVVNTTIANYENCVLKSEMMYFGGETPDLSTSIGRRKRAISDADLKDFSTTPGFEGIIQDVQVNDKKFEFFASNPSGNTILVATAANLTEGATSTRQICMNETCENGGTCTEQVFNDFRCDCQAGYIGKNCSYLDFCNSAPCPANSRCQSRIDGYECIAEATFNGRNSLVKYEPKVQDTTVLSILSLSLRTHSEYAAIFYLEHGETFLKLRLEDGNVRMNYKLNERMSETLKFDRNHPVNTGDWFQIEAEFQVGEIVLRIRENKTILEEKSVNVANLDVAAMIRDGAMILLGGLDVVTYARGWEQPFKGCLRDVRVGDILLPFFSDNQFVNNTSKDKFLATDIRIQGIGCDNGQACLRSQSMCLHNSLCINTWNDFKCDCSSGYEGSYCQTDIDECTSDPSQCSPNGKCVDGIGFSSCSCRKGYEGNSCQTDINFCKNDSCENGGSCYEQDTDYGCNCSNEWTGRNCNILVNSSCNDVPCKNGGSCQTINLTTSSGVIESFNCTCMDGYHGPTCEQMIDLCVDVPCSNNATCNPLPSTYECICQPGFTGVRCETNIDDCTSNGCEYGDCQDGLNGYYCNCTEGWTGKYCNEDVDECNTTTPCQRGVCINTQGGFYCNCNGTGYNGTNCADEVDECSLVPAQCKNGANCTNTEGSYNCSCTLGYTGDDCDIPDCNANQCENNSTCQVKDQKWMCQCLEYYFGDQCETAGPCTYGYCDDINTNICQQDEVTMNYTCVCKQGWEGENCTKDIDECLIPSTCLNGATCNNLNGSYTCDCVPGYTGYNCGSDINECLTNQCLNGGTCNDYLNYFNCTCTAGYKGDLCGEDVDECLSTPCKNNQPCINSEGSFSCNCSENYLGNLCQHNNPCDVETCQNGGLCKTNVTEDNNYVPFCKCVNGYEGARCERADPSKQPVDDSVNIWAIIGPIIAILVIIIIIVAVVFFRMARKKRATRGQYCPSQQENAGARVELGNVLKKPPQERLI